MKQILEDAKTIFAELIGAVGGLIWAYKTNWDYEPLILFFVSVTGLIISLVLFQNRKSINTISKAEEMPEKTNVLPQTDKAFDNTTIQYTDISPVTIKNKISGAPLFQQADVAKNFIGLNIQWVLKLFLIHKRTEDKVTVVMSSTENVHFHIYFIVSINDYPILKIADDEKLFAVTGKIIECKLYELTLDLVSLKEL